LILYFVEWVDIMKKKEEALREFVTELFPDPDENVIRTIAAVTELERGETNESQETRKIKITEDTDGKITAKSIKMYNLIKVSFHDLIGFLGKGAAIPFLEDTRVKIIFALFTLLHDFFPKLTYEFNEQDAKLLLGIFELRRNEFTAKDIAESCQRFAPALTEDQINRSLGYFKKLKVLKQLAGGRYVVREKMIYERN
jgi:hypothetical protein